MVDVQSGDEHGRRYVGLYYNFSAEPLDRGAAWRQFIAADLPDALEKLIDNRPPLHIPVALFEHGQIGGVLVWYSSFIPVSADDDVAQLFQICIRSEVDSYDERIKGFLS